MKKVKILWFICDILIIIFLLGFVFSLFWYRCGSFEMMPTEEQQEKAQPAAILLMILNGALGSVCIAAWRGLKKSMHRK